MEIAVKPLQLDRRDVAGEYEILLANYPNLRVMDIDREVAREAAALRAAYRVRPTDGVQIAACIVAGATAFVTNDRDLRRIRELDVLLLADDSA